MPATPDAVDIDRRLACCAEQWQLAIGDRLDGGFLAHVYECRALEAFDERAGALLLERVRPGTSLRGQPESVAIKAAAATLRALHSTCPRNEPGIPPFAEWLDWFFERVAVDAEPGTVGVAMLPVLRGAAEQLAGTAPIKTLVHGDFVSKNLLHNGEGAYTAVDPMPFLGDPCSDAGFFSAYQPPARSIAPRAAAIAEHAGMDPQRAMRWAAIWAIGEACETWRDDSDELQRWVAGPECAEILAL